jgi:hypothetical protein
VDEWRGGQVAVDARWVPGCVSGADLVASSLGTLDAMCEVVTSAVTSRGQQLTRIGRPPRVRIAALSRTLGALLLRLFWTATQRPFVLYYHPSCPSLESLLVLPSPRVVAGGAVPLWRLPQHLLGLVSPNKCDWRSTTAGFKAESSFGIQSLTATLSIAQWKSRQDRLAAVSASHVFPLGQGPVPSEELRLAASRSLSHSLSQTLVGPLPPVLRRPGSARTRLAPTDGSNRLRPPTMAFLRDMPPWSRLLDAHADVLGQDRERQSGHEDVLAAFDTLTNRLPVTSPLWSPPLTSDATSLPTPAARTGKLAVTPLPSAVAPLTTAPVWTQSATTTPIAAVVNPSRAPSHMSMGSDGGTEAYGPPGRQRAPASSPAVHKIPVPVDDTVIAEEFNQTPQVEYQALRAASEDVTPSVPIAHVSSASPADHEVC